MLTQVERLYNRQFPKININEKVVSEGQMCLAHFNLNFHSASWCDLYWSYISPNLKLQYLSSPEIRTVAFVKMLWSFAITYTCTFSISCIWGWWSSKDTDPKLIRFWWHSGYSQVYTLCYFSLQSTKFCSPAWFHRMQALRVTVIEVKLTFHKLDLWDTRSMKNTCT